MLFVIYRAHVGFPYKKLHAFLYWERSGPQIILLTNINKLQPDIVRLTKTLTQRGRDLTRS